MNIIKLQNITANEIFRLFDHLKKFAKKDEDPDQFVINHYKNFFPSLTFEQDVYLQNIISLKDTNELKAFIEVNPDIEVNLDGDSIIKTKTNDGIVAKEKSLIMTYEYLKNHKNLKSHDKQIIRAFELKCLKNIKVNDNEYNILKLQIFKKIKFSDTINIKNYESIIDINIKTFLSKVFKYTLQNNADTFLKYVLYYLDVVRLNKESDLKTIYLKNIESIL